MRMLLLISAAGFLAACNPPSNDEPGQFETIALSVIENPACVFTPIDSEGVAFATYQDNPDFMAVARFGGETIKLVPREIPSFDGDTFDVTYDVIDYLKWQIRVTSDNGVGDMRLLQDGQPTEIALDITGSCP